MATLMAFSHVPVLAKQCLNLIRPACENHSAPLVVDATLGLGGHSEMLLQAMPHIRVIGIDRDKAAIEHAQARLRDYSDRFIAVHATYDQMAEVVHDYSSKVTETPRENANAILMDLGVSSMQLDDDDRGFAYSRDADLDMRMDQQEAISAKELLATVSQRELVRILRVYGEERFAPRIAAAICSARETSPITTTKVLADLVDKAVPASQRRKGHPAKRTFQALRIAVNDEIAILESALPVALKLLASGGRLVVEAYHSLEDRLVKEAMRRVCESDVPDGVPMTAERLGVEYKLVHRKAIKASEEEIQNNPRSASVRLRAVERISTERRAS